MRLKVNTTVRYKKSFSKNVASERECRRETGDQHSLCDQTCYRLSTECVIHSHAQNIYFKTIVNLGSNLCRHHGRNIILKLIHCCIRTLVEACF